MADRKRKQPSRRAAADEPRRHVTLRVAEEELAELRRGAAARGRTLTEQVLVPALRDARRACHKKY